MKRQVASGDRRAEPGPAHDPQRLPQTSAGRTAEDAKEHRQSAAANASAEASPIVRYQRNEARISADQVRSGNLHKLQILRHEHTRHPHRHDDHAAQDQT